MFRFTFDFNCCKHVETENRKITTNDSQSNLIYGNNKVVNSKYTWYSFIPLILFAHICRFMNFYFILIGCFQLWKEVSPVNPLSTWAPIVIIFAIAFIREGIDDISQHRQDHVFNSRKFNVIRDHKTIEVKSEEILVGDIVILEKLHESPADIALIYSTNDDGTCCLETSNLDGETKLKIKYSLPETQLLGVSGLSEQKLIIDCLPPNPQLQQFKSTININGVIFPMSTSNFIQAGTTIQNAEQIYGVACYTGKYTKIGMNSKSPPIKWTQIERFIDKCSISIFIFQLILAIIWGIVGNIQLDKFKKDAPYLRLDIEKGTKGILIYFRAYLLTSVMIPISLKVTLDICKYVYATWIRNDFKMYDRTTHQRPLVNNTSVIEDLGAVQYIFTDKTGTITENKMKLQKIIINDTIYGASEQAEDIYSDQNLTNLFLKQKDDHERMMAVYFMYCLSVCHTLKKSGTLEEPVFEGQSPEEICFLNGLTKLKFNVEINNGQITIENQHLGIEPITFRIHAILNFRTKIRRMDVVVENVDTKEFFLFSKGSCEVLHRFTQNTNQNHDEKENGDSSDNRNENESEIIQDNEFLQSVSTFASLGLRVMATSYKKLSENEFHEFYQAYDVAQTQISHRKSQILRAFESIEQGQTILGITGIEDKLQFDVPETISMMREAGIKVWMVTGDMLETAIKVAHSSGLITKSPDIFELTKDIDTPIEEVLHNLNDYFNSIDIKRNPVYLVIDGLSPITDKLLDEHSKLFAEVASQATCVICARTMPKQKAQFVHCIQKLKKVTLAVGDGGNDVTMLRESHIGVGIMGLEGTQASVASDFAIKQFCHLQRLLLIHGRFASYRTSWLVQFCFYKSFMIAIVQVAFNFWNGFSARTFISDFNLLCYNAIFTLLPVVFFLFDKDVEDDTLFLHPYLYADSRLRTFCNIRSIFWWIVKALYQSIVVVLIVHFCCTEGTITLSDGSPISLNEIQQVAYSSLILNVLFTVAFDTQQFTSLNFIFIWGNWLLYILFTIIANLIPNMSIVSDMYLTVWRTYANPNLWMVTLTATSFSIMPVIFFNAMFTTYLPTRAQRLRFREVRKQSKFQPAYKVLKPGGEVSQILKETVWDQSHNICSPLAALCCRKH
ncbi:Phospholipid-transporting ATPase 2 [Tritrichomonas foetus]|uniref:Phospholipid-transporting ATPase n=1 Tax=Tritrichomonas foetus TaxID=1144522 RepID=A0A1J4K9Z9_9EUKA|nr:Phospholipid-transporting ATPase 2 [Tritrichomonas foetus]|eukprot:OHT06516.1 Phospholipid-transporting ATPase 2 [Tritrichomonas foetus]